MPITVEDLEAAALQLQPQARGELIRRLLRTLENDEEALTQDEWLQFWGDEAERRCEELDSGKVVALDGPTTLKQWKTRYQ